MQVKYKKKYFFSYCGFYLTKYNINILYKREKLFHIFMSIPFLYTVIFISRSSPLFPS